MQCIELCGQSATNYKSTGGFAQLPAARAKRALPSCCDMGKTGRAGGGASAAQRRARRRRGGGRAGGAGARGGRRAAAPGRRPAVSRSPHLIAEQPWHASLQEGKGQPDPGRWRLYAESGTIVLESVQGELSGMSAASKQRCVHCVLCAEPSDAGGVWAHEQDVQVPRHQ